MKIIAHRINEKAKLTQLDPKFGVEVDIRSYGEKLIIHHDPFCEGEDFNEWIKAYRHSTLILNVKEEGLESKLINLMADYNIADYFFLDQSFPFLIRWANKGEKRCAVRVSEYEHIETAMTLAGKVSWVWVDCFSRFPLTSQDAQKLTSSGFKLCIVSPELQGRDPDREIPAMIDLLIDRKIHVDAVCTKRSDLWNQFAQSQKS
jgi:hypothetical protein